MTAQVLKVGQVWRRKKKDMCNQCQFCNVETTAVLGCADLTCSCHTKVEQTGTIKVAIVATSWSKVFVSGTIDEIDPEWTNEFLLENYEPDGDYY